LGTDDDKEKLSNFYDNDKDILDIKEFYRFEINNKNRFNNNEVDKNKYYHDNKMSNMEEEEKENSNKKG
jgi:hypothetical protein